MFLHCTGFQPRAPTNAQLLSPSHLLEKIQKMGKDSLLKEREVINGEEVPLPIKRRLIV